MAKQSSISIWSVLALLTIVAGGTVTLVLDQLSVRAWAHSGIRRPIGSEQYVDLPAGESLIYYESPDFVPGQPVYFHIQDVDGNPVRWRTPADDNSFKLLTTGWSGRAMWQVDLPEPARCAITVLNDLPETEGEDRSRHQMVIDKQPETLGEATRNRRVIQYTGAGLTIGIAIVLYIVHGVTLQRRAATATPNALGEHAGDTTFRR